jgi:hypothetical protein
MKLIIIHIFITIFIVCSCSSNNKSKGYDLYEVNKDKPRYYKVAYYMKENRVDEVDIKKIDYLVEYYKVTFTQYSLPAKEEYFKNNRRSSYKVYHYNASGLKSITNYDSSNKKLKEYVYKDKKLINTIQYIYQKGKYLAEKRQYKDGQSEGWWIYYDLKNRPIQKKLYKKGKLTIRYEYQYDKDNNIISDKGYDSKGKLIYKDKL